MCERAKWDAAGTMTHESGNTGAVCGRAFALLPVSIIIIAILPKNTSKTLMSRKFMRVIRSCTACAWSVCAMCMCKMTHSTYIGERNKNTRTHVTLCGQNSNLHCNFGVHGLRVSVFDSISAIHTCIFEKQGKNDSDNATKRIFGQIHIVAGRRPKVWTNAKFYSIQLSYVNEVIIFNELIECKCACI